jgi:ADP-ribose pyrophosphatase
MLPKVWKTLSSLTAYQNPWITVREDIAQMPNGKNTLYGVVECPPAVGVLPFIDDNHVVLVRQYRYVFGENHRWEIPTGAVKPDEPLKEAARRELREEIGYDAEKLQFVSSFFSSKSVMREVAHLYLGYGLTQVQALPDETEFLEVVVLPFEQVLQLALTSEIRDSMTVIAVLHAARLRGE